MSKRETLYGIWIETEGAAGWYYQNHQEWFTDNDAMAMVRRDAQGGYGGNGYWTYTVREVGDDGKPVEEVGA